MSQRIPPGSWGRIRTSPTDRGTVEATARYTTFSGKTLEKSARGETDQAAIEALIVKLDRLRQAEGSDSEIKSTTTVERLGELFLEEKRLARKSPGTLTTYESTIRNHVNPAIGERRLAECRTSVLDRVLKSHAATGASTDSLRAVLSGMFGLATRHDVYVSNPMRSVAHIPRDKKPVEALDMEQVQDVRTLITAHMKSKRPGPKPSNDLRDFVDVMLGTGCRLGETSGLRYPDINLASTTPRLTVTGTVKNVTGRGTYRQPWPKTKAGWRTLYLPPFVVEIFMRRMVENRSNEIEAVFPTRAGTWRQDSGWERMWNRVVDDTPYDWVTFHTFRKSVATLLNVEVGVKAAQAQLGHENSDVTEKYYVERAAEAPDLTLYLERFRPQ